MEQTTTQQGQPERDAAYALCAVIAQMGLALRESQEPVAELGGLFSHLAQTLNALRSMPLAQCANDKVSEATVRGLVEQLQTDVFKGIQQLQFYDRMVQHLSHLQAYLTSVANELSSGGGVTNEVWDELHARLRQRLISDQQRGLLDLFLSPGLPARVSAQAARPEGSEPGSSEMF